jgi:TatD DNase family protein
LRFGFWVLRGGREPQLDLSQNPKLKTQNSKLEMLVDTHAHLDFPEFADDFDAILHRAKEAGVGRIIAIGTTLKSSRKAIEFAEHHPEIYAVVGIHPNSVTEERGDFLPELQELAKHPKVVAIGETGLDYHYLPSKLQQREVSETTFGAASTQSIELEIRDEAEKAAQAVAFEQHLELAAATGKSAVIHQRDSWADTINILRTYSASVRAVMHCFSGSLAQAREVVELGHFVSFTGIVTFKSASDVRQAAVSVPLDRIMVETDSPYLAPEPHRGKRCEPAFVRETAALLANIRGLTLESFAERTTRTAEFFFAMK